jgi:putative two-component system response regulator
MSDADTLNELESSADLAQDKVLLIVDDDPKVVKSIVRSLHGEKIEIATANSGREAMDIIRTNRVGVVLSDQKMPEMDGVSFLSQVRAHDPLIVRLLLTGYASIDNAMDAIKRSQIFAYLTKPWEPDELKGTLHRAFEHHFLSEENQRLQKLTQQQNRQLRQLNSTLEMRVEERTHQLAAAVREGILMLSLAAEARDNITGNHIRRIQNFSYRISLALGLSETESDRIGFFSMMHDVGKIHISDNILNKNGALTQEERRIMQTHTTAGEKILGQSPYYEVARQIARSHHEWVDGSGYPDGLKGNAIPLSARIVAVADVFDALTSARPYKEAWPVDRALTEINRLAGRQFDPNVVDAFSAVVADGLNNDLE